MKKILTYNLPDHLYSAESTMGKTGLQEFDGPETLVLHLEKETGYIHESFELQNEHDRPLALNLERVEFVAITDEDFIKIALIYGGLSAPKIYEIAVGPEDQLNNTLKDPSDIREVFDEHAVMLDYTAPLKFRIITRDRSDAFIRDVRNSMLDKSDGRIASDMPEAMKQAWLDYRQKLRDLPADWLEVPNHLIRFPLPPNETFDVNFHNSHIEVIMIADRTPEDLERLVQLPPGVA